MTTLSAQIPASNMHPTIAMYRTSSNGSTFASTSSSIHPATTAATRLQRLPTPPRSPGLAPLGKQLTLIEPPMTKGIRFLILDCPTDSSLPFYMAELKRNDVTDVVRCCEPTYNGATLQAENISVHDWSFRDGAVPPANIIKSWLQLVDSRIVRRLNRQQRGSSPSISEEEDDIQPPPTIAVHCVAGLGRAPILVAIALVELGMANLDTIEFIRRRRRGCFNSNQIQYIDGYKRGKILKHTLGSGSVAPSFNGSGTASSSSSVNGSSGLSVAGSVKNGLTKMFRLKP
ncbi:Protein tyrosine phosphatase type IVA 1 [Entomortierella beljakovae]|nr:Protein tyrosine phosphatase type IVA 1 [Entomortierella beljakovae]